MIRVRATLNTDFNLALLSLLSLFLENMDVRVRVRDQSLRLGLEIGLGLSLGVVNKREPM